MIRYAGFTKAKAKALTLFYDARLKLNELHTSMANEHQECNDAISARVERQKFLENEMLQVSKVIFNIDKIVGSTDG